MIEKYREFMQGRYGFDKLGMFLLIAAFVISMLSRLLWLPWLYFLTIALDIIFIYRFLSRKEYARRRENRIFMKWFDIVKDYFHRDRQNYNYYTCPVCKTRFSVSKSDSGANYSKKVICPKCRNEF